MLSTITGCLKGLSAALLYSIPHTKKAAEAIKKKRRLELIIRFLLADKKGFKIERLGEKKKTLSYLIPKS